MADVTAPPVAPCACHYNTASEPPSPQQSHLPIYHTGEYSHVAAWPSSPRQSRIPVSRAVSTHLLQPGRPLLGSLRCQSVCQPLQSGLPLLSSLRCQSLSTGSAHLLQCTLPPLRTLCSASSSVPLSPLPQSAFPLFGRFGSAACPFSFPPTP